MTAALLALVACLLDLGQFGRLVETPHGLRASVVLPRNACPAGLYPSGWRVSLGVSLCQRGCGPDDADDNSH